MRIFYDNNTRTVTIENVNKYFSNASLEALPDGDNISIKYVNTDKLEIYDHFSAFQKENGTQAGANVTEVVDYLNLQFNTISFVQETTASLQAKRPLKTVNSQSLEGAGDITISEGRPKLALVKSNAATNTETVVASWEIPPNSITNLSGILARVRFQAGGNATCIWRLRVGANGTIADTLLAQLTTSAAQVANAQGGSEFIVEFPTTTSAIGSGFAIMQGAVLGTTTVAGATATINPANKVFINVTMQLSVAQASQTRAAVATWNS